MYLTSDDPLEMVLNSLAILFLNELDDKLGTDKDLFR
jgi:hypothetical protein